MVLREMSVNQTKKYSADVGFYLLSKGGLYQSTFLCLLLLRGFELSSDMYDNFSLKPDCFNTFSYVDAALLNSASLHDKFESLWLVILGICLSTAGGDLNRNEHTSVYHSFFCRDNTCCFVNPSIHLRNQFVLG